MSESVETEIDETTGQGEQADDYYEGLASELGFADETVAARDASLNPPQEQPETEQAPEPEPTDEPEPSYTEILSLAKQEKELKKQKAELEAKREELRQNIRSEVLEELKRQAVKNPVKFYEELGYGEGKRGSIAQDLWVADLPEDERPSDYQQKSYTRKLEEQIQELRGLIEERDPKKYVQEVEEQRQYNQYMGELTGRAKSSPAIDAALGAAAPDALWNMASQIYKQSGQVPAPDEVVEYLEAELKETFTKMTNVFGGETARAPSGKAPSQTLSDSETPRTRRKVITEADILREAEELIAPYFRS